MCKSFIPYLQHILDECHFIRSVITDDMEIEQFLSDETLKRAVTVALPLLVKPPRKSLET